MAMNRVALGRRRRRILLPVLCFVIGIWLVAPILVIIPLSFAKLASFVFPPHSYGVTWYRSFFTDPAWQDAFKNSLKVGVLVAIFATVLATAAAVGAARLPRRARGVVGTIVVMPMIVPGVVLAIGIYSVYLKLHLLGTLTGFVIAHSVLAFPFVFITVSASLSNFDRNLEIAASSLGAGRWATFRTVTFPLILPGILVGAVFAFEASFDEIIIALFINTPYLITMPVKMYTSISHGTDPTVSAVSSLIIGFVIVTIVTSVTISSTIRRRRGVAS